MPRTYENKAYGLYGSIRGSKGLARSIHRDYGADRSYPSRKSALAAAKRYMKSPDTTSYDEIYISEQGKAIDPKSYKTIWKDTK